MRRLRARHQNTKWSVMLSTDTDEVEPRRLNQIDYFEFLKNKEQHYWESLIPMILKTVDSPYLIMSVMLGRFHG